jgi:hypothetical protein
MSTALARAEQTQVCGESLPADGAAQ